jgi:hypothetical protein
VRRSAKLEWEYSIKFEDEETEQNAPGIKKDLRLNSTFLVLFRRILADMFLSNFLVA